MATAACGLGIYRDKLLGESFQGNLFTCEPVNLLVHRLVVSPRDSTFIGRRASDESDREFLASTDTWFRPVQARTAPDGSLWVVDMYRFVIEHPRYAGGHLGATLSERGREQVGIVGAVAPRRVHRLQRAG